MSNFIRKIGDDTDLDCLLNKEFTSPLRAAYVEVGEDKVCLPIYYQDYEERLRNFEVRDEDVFLFGLAKSGTTWCHEMLWLLTNNLNYEGAKEHSTARCSLLEGAILYDFKLIKGINILEGKDPLQLVEEREGPRCIKSHLNWSLLPEQFRNGTKQPKIIGLFRNPKDTCVSHYHQAKGAAGYKGTFEEFVELYLGGRVPYGPYWKYTLNLWNQRHRPNIFLVKYEEMKADLPGVIKKIAEFLNKDLTEAQVEKLAEHLSLQSMKNNPAVNHKDLMKQIDEAGTLTVAKHDFVRTGKVGDYTSIMTPEIIKKFDEWTKENLLGTDFNLFDNY